jgi:hypothetical protein
MNPGRPPCGKIKLPLPLRLSRTPAVGAVLVKGLHYSCESSSFASGPSIATG